MAKVIAVCPRCTGDILDTTGFSVVAGVKQHIECVAGYVPPIDVTSVAALNAIIAKDYADRIASARKQNAFFRANSLPQRIALGDIPVPGLVPVVVIP